MTRLNAKNNAKSTLSSAINASTTSFSVVNGAVFPAAPFLVTIGEEIIRVNTKSSNTFSNVQRGYENTTASSHNIGDVVENRFTAGTLAELGQEIDEHAGDTSNPHSVTKSQVGLGNVENYGLATQTEAEAGAINNKYMTPLRTKQAIEDATVSLMPVSGGTLENYVEKTITLSGTSTTINLSQGNVFKHTLTGNTTYTISNAVGSIAHSFTLIITQSSVARTITFPSSLKWQNGEIPDMSGEGKTYILTFLTVDGGTNWFGMFGGEF